MRKACEETILQDFFFVSWLVNPISKTISIYGSFRSLFFGKKAGKGLIDTINDAITCSMCVDSFHGLTSWQIMFQFFVE